MILNKKIVIIGSTGSVGRQALDVIRDNPNDFEVVGLSAHQNQELLNSQIEEFTPKFGGTCDLEEVRKMVNSKETDIVFIGCRGTDFLPALIDAIKAGKKIAMANKEMIVENGEEIMKLIHEYDTEFIPVDSEHSAIFQCMQGHDKDDIEKIILTCSGGACRDKTAEELENVTVEVALSHPTWNMGKKITIDSATLMNKALEIIEAKYLFGLNAEQIEVLIHPQSIVHSMVQFKDGNMITHFGYPDMRIPIAYALYYPDIKDNKLPRVDLVDKKLEFYKPNIKNFPSIDFAYKALHQGPSTIKKLNQANDIAVKKFVDGEILFNEIFQYIERETF
ncbi:1-deoxy-D-xylulose-5-phosphate reductoisomerase [Patescibacteria group bacterium]|nr:1-deoxy-D-xylulose-5-phosphate reductoisomerase [Patescibacteria group bacterium]